MRSLIAVSLTGFFPLVISHGITLTGPNQLTCGLTACFDWTGGQAPYIFQPIIYQPTADTTAPTVIAIEPVITDLTNVWATIYLEPGNTVQFTVQDANNSYSNKLVLQITDRSSCPDPPPVDCQIFDPVHGLPIAVSGGISAVHENIGISTMTKGTLPSTSFVSLRPTLLETSIMTLTISTSPIPTIEASIGNSYLRVGIVILFILLGALPIVCCTIVWYCRRRILRGRELTNGIAQKWEERRNRKGLEQAMENGIRSNPRFLEANPFATPFSSSNAFATSNGVLQSAKERRQRQQQRRQSMSTTSMTDTLRPISTILSASIWPGRSDDAMATEEDPYLTQSMRHDSLLTSIPSIEGSRSYHALTSAELAQMLRFPPRSSSSCHTGGTLRNSPNEPSPYYRAWTKENEGNSNNRDEKGGMTTSPR